MASGRQVVYTLRLNSNASAILNQADEDAIKFDSTMNHLGSTMTTFGAIMAASFAVDTGKQWIQTAADYETAMLRIKNASDNTFDGLKNQLFINKEVDQFKLKLEDAIDSYGSFLFKIKNANLTNDQKNNIFNELTTVGKVGGLSNSQMNSTIYELGTLLGVGTLEARQLRALGNVHPNIMPYIADVLGLKNGKGNPFDKGAVGQTELQQIYKAMSSGKLTKAGINSLEVLPKALELYYNDVKDKLPETLTTVQSELNNLSNSWERFKINFTLDDKTEVIDFFHELSDGIKFLSDHESEIMKIGHAVVDVIKLYTEWRLAILAIKGAGNVVQFLRGDMVLFASEQQRLNNALSLYKSKSIEATESNIEYAESQKIVRNAEDSIIETNIKEIEVIDKKTISLDLFTEAQLTNIAATEKLRDEWVQMDMFGTGVTGNDTAFLGFGSKGNGGNGLNDRYRYSTEDEILSIEAEQLALRSNLSLQEANTEQANLFSKAEMDASISIGKYSSELELQNALIEDNIALQAELSEQAAASFILNNTAIQGINKVGGMSGIVGGAVGGIGASLSGAILPVFLTGMAAELLASLLPSDISGKGWDLKRLGKVGALGNSGEQLALGLSIANIFGFDPMQTIKDESFAQQNSPRGIPFINPANPWDSMMGNWAPAPVSSASNNFNTQDLLKKLAKDQHHLKGNSSNYFTVNIHEMNGVKQFTVEQSGGELPTKRVADIAGDTFIKMMTDAINDSQVIKPK